MMTPTSSKTRPRRPVKSSQGPPKGPVWARRLAGEAGAANIAYCAGWDVRRREAADLELLPYDLWVNRAHCTMLARAEVIPPAHLVRILRALDAIELLHARGRFVLDPDLEDVHLNVEHYVEEREGAEVAGLMHTGRSRNDQVATDMRLLMRDRLLDFVGESLKLTTALERLARSHVRTIMPGLTHHQPAAWTTLGHWAAAHAFAFLRDAQALLALLPLVNRSPLGAAASFGTSWPVDRDFAARAMGFADVQENTLDCVTNRCEPEARVAGALAVWAHHAATLAQDLILFSSPPWGVMRLGDDFVTGSSIMPQKRNPDFAEVTKAKAALAGATAAALLDLTRGDPSGYNREQQWSKYLMLDLWAELAPAPKVLTGALASLRVDRQRLRTLLAGHYLEAADVADYLAQTRRVAFRRAYRWLGEAVRHSEAEGLALIAAVNQVLADARGIEALSAAEQRDLSDPGWLVGRRISRGGPAPESVSAQCAILHTMVGVHERMRRRAVRSVGQGRALLAREIKRLTGKREAT